MIDDAARWKRVKQVLQDALERPADEHERFLHSVCRDDHELRREVESLLLAHAAAGSFAQGPAIEALPPSAAIALRDGKWAEHRVQRGARLGHYEILSAIGKGGMGEVWKARDTTLRREVAIKLLPEGFAQDPDRLARLEREATLLASLNHPNIATIHGLEADHGTRFLVLELVEGRTLADRLQRGAIPVEESLKLARQIADALEAAHEKGVVHRDLKPANVKVTPEGRVKVLDFGLAKALASGPEDVPSLTATATEVGVITGTPAYMSPEQARGEVVGRQTDIWSFGVVLLELLSGVSPFGRQTTADTLASVLGTQPDYSVLPSDTPVGVRDLVRRCLEKDRKRRWQHMGDVRIEVEEALSALTADAAAGPVPAWSNGRPWLVAGAITLAVLVGITGWFLAHRAASPTAAAVVRLSIPSVEPPFLSPYGSRHLAISEDGSRVAYASANRLRIRRMGQEEAVAIDVASSEDPFFSPNGEWLGFFDVRGLRKVPALGGTPVSIAATSGRPGGGTWRADGTIVFATIEGLYQVSENGGEPRLLVKPEARRKERAYAWPQFMPDGRSVLFTIVSEESIEGAQIAVLDLQTLEARTVLKGGSAARYASTGHLVYASGQTFKAIVFDSETQQTRGDPVSLPDIEIATSTDNGAAEFALSETGTLLFVTPNVPGQLRTLSWVDRQGKEEPLALAPARYEYARISPDGTRVALDIPGANRDIWIWNLQRPGLTKLTNGPTEDMLPVWSSDGRRVFFASDRTGNFDVYSQASDGSTTERVEFAGPGNQMPQAFTPDGTRLLVGENFKDLSMLNLARPDRLEPLLHGEFVTRLGAVSPDGNWIAYESNESGDRFEIFLRPFPNVSGQREKVSIDGGRFPLWRPKGGSELFYIDLRGGVMAASVKLTPGLSLGRVTKLFNWEKPPSGPSGRRYDISPVDGRFLMTKSAPAASNGQINISVVLNWFEELRERAPLRVR